MGMTVGIVEAVCVSSSGKRSDMMDLMALG